MLGDNLDLSTAIKWLDSAAQSGIPIIDTVLSQYELHALNATEFALNKNKQTFALFKKYPNFYSEKSNFHKLVLMILDLSLLMIIMLN